MAQTVAELVKKAPPYRPYFLATSSAQGKNASYTTQVTGNAVFWWASMSRARDLEPLDLKEARKTSSDPAWEKPPSSKPSEMGSTATFLRGEMEERVYTVLTNVALTPLEASHLANWRSGLMWPWLGYGKTTT
uniref:Uncharacterized protein n=1 Tax=Opuntia streptacantha TaxID=393608 RepID=A0A7C9F8V9_OPUST